ncbi:hydroxyethylthiazole kinase [Endozoicomonas montiporae]|uniref:Hydroxyethylthiazole kinase n=2 Tax=Endozoicomonas montiporae TaxID=1027273 RepID=A0A081N5U8_9GAMM|nr:hydroxyethylthiazole kinase [Endozoicomonas montiporae]AMO57272.1 hydroxyethylthiazole kinase [Endozoicomonas montiporae CL-33]KEQ13821.1 hydroxyethylthiazole kinase [Endozoicomonas montiporae]
MHSEIFATLAALRQQQPVVHNITNQVVTNTTANALLAIGASPVMAHAPEEMIDMVSIANALVINTGTPSQGQRQAMKAAIHAAKEQGKPWILDPVGAGATPYRLELNSELLELQPNAIRGNASEILTLLTGSPTGRGVDSACEDTFNETLDYLQEQAGKLKTVLAVTGATDYITDGNRLATLTNGHPMMAKVTGTGCTATAITGAFLASCDDPWLAVVASIACLGIAGEKAAFSAKGPGSLQMHLLDELYLLDEETIKTRLSLSSQ